MLYLCAGHYNNDPGAVNAKKEKEADYTKELRNLIQSKLNGKAKLDDDKDDLATVIKKIKDKCTSKDLIVDIHWNSGSPEANGTEVIIGSDAGKTSKTIAEKAKEVLISFGFKDRGVKTEDQSHRGRLGIFRTVAPTILIEVCFLSNEGDMKKYQENKDKIATKLAEIFKPYL